MINSRGKACWKLDVPVKLTKSLRQQVDPAQVNKGDLCRSPGDLITRPRAGRFEKRERVITRCN